MDNFYFPAALIPLVMTDDPAKRAKLEEQFGVTQDEAVTTLIEATCWGDGLPQFQDGKGTPDERREAFRAKYREQQRRKFEDMPVPVQPTRYRTRPPKRRTLH
jgi:hypothetical protein